LGCVCKIGSQLTPSLASKEKSLSIEYRIAKESDLENLVTLLADDVLGSEREDISQPLNSKYRIAFQIDTDYDELADQVNFCTSNWSEELSPKIIFFYSESVNSHSIELINDRNEHIIYPNPFNPQTRISYTLQESDKVKIKIYNLKGQLVETLVDEYKPAGLHSILWNAENQASGVYFYSIKTGEIETTGKCILLK